MNLFFASPEQPKPPYAWRARLHTELILRDAARTIERGWTKSEYMSLGGTRFCATGAIFDAAMEGRLRRMPSSFGSAIVIRALEQPATQDALYALALGVLDGDQTWMIEEPKIQPNHLLNVNASQHNICSRIIEMFNDSRERVEDVLPAFGSALRIVTGVQQPPDPARAAMRLTYERINTVKLDRGPAMISWTDPADPSTAIFKPILTAAITTAATDLDLASAGD